VSAAGRLKTRLVLQAPGETADGQGGVVRDYTPVATVWAAVTPLAARDSVEADAPGMTQRVRIVLRDEFDLTPGHRLIDGPRVYRITALNRRERFIEIDAECRIA
jgi:SPP1 family predicted phage head-tail adaptor